MTYTPRSDADVLEGLVARSIARGVLTDLAEGAVWLQLLGVVSEEAALIERAMAALARPFFDLTGADLDNALSELPGDQGRQGPSTATGAVMRLTRGDSTGELVIEPFTYVFGHRDDPKLRFVLVETVTFPDGEATVPLAGAKAIRVACTTPGEGGNVDESGVIDHVVSGGDDLIDVSNIYPLGGGSEREGDAVAILRARGYLAGLPRTQPLTLEGWATGYEGEDGTRIRSARLWETSTPGYAELVIDDGYGLAGFTRASPASSGTVPDGGMVELYHEAPRVAPVTTITIDGTPTTVAALGGVSKPEQGIVLLPEGVLTGGEVWEIPAGVVYTGVVAEMQARVNGMMADPVGEPGRRTAGNRIPVVPAQLEFLPSNDDGFQLVIDVVMADGFLFADYEDAIADTALSFFAALRPGEVYWPSRLSRSISALAYIHAVKLPFPTSERYPSSGRKRLSVDPDKVKVT